MTTTAPKIYVASLSDYNNGILHGRWIDCDKDADWMRAEIADMLRGSHYPNVTVEHPETGEMVPSAEEYAIHDSEGLPFTGEHIDLDRIAEYMETIDDLNDSEIEAFHAWIENDSDREIDVDSFRDQYRGCWDTLEDYVQNYWEECSEFKGDSQWWHPTNYIDWDRMGNDLRLSGDVWTHDGSEGIHVFDNR